MAESHSTSTPKHTPGPWRWEVSLKSKEIQLCGGRPAYDLNVIDFVRWGMGGAAPRFNKSMDGSGRLMLMHRADEFTAVVPGREHHAEWFRSIDHPDAHLIAAAPAMLAALKSIAAMAVHWQPLTPGDIREVTDAIAKAEGR